MDFPLFPSDDEEYFESEFDRLIEESRQREMVHIVDTLNTIKVVGTFRIQWYTQLLEIDKANKIKSDIARWTDSATPDNMSKMTRRELHDLGADVCQAMLDWMKDESRLNNMN
jgi:hypothetical protein